MTDQQSQALTTTQETNRDRMTTTGGINDTPNVADLAGDDPEFVTGDQEPVDGVDAGVVLLTKDEFFAAFTMLFAAPNMLPVPPLPIACLPIQPNETVQARAASDVIYDMALESRWLRWMIEPQSLWMQRALVMATFAGGKFMAINKELSEREPAPKKQASEPVDPEIILPGENPFPAGSVFS